MKGLNAFKIHVFFFKNHINLTIRRGKEMSESYLFIKGNSILAFKNRKPPLYVFSRQFIESSVSKKRILTHCFNFRD